MKQYFAKFLLPLFICAWMICSHCMAQDITPSPTCNPTQVSAYINSIGPDPTYYPNEPFTLSIHPSNGDWPSTPTKVYWCSDLGCYWGGLSHIFHIPENPPDEITFDAAAIGDGIRPECKSWLAQAPVITARRYDYIPPTPTPVPTVSPTETPTPSWTPLPCLEICVHPQPGQQGIPPERLIIEHDGIRFAGLTMMAGPAHPVTQIGEKKFLAENLQPNTWYIYYVVGGYWPDGSENECFAGFETGPPSTPTPTPSPYPTPTPGPHGWVLSKAGEGK